MLRSYSLKAALIGGACAMALATAAHAEVRTFNVPAGDLQAALDSYARQSGVQLLYRVDLVNGVSSKGVQGALSPDDALSMVLADTGLEIRRHQSGAVAIVPAGEGGSDPQSGSAAGDGADGTVEALIVTAQKREEDIQDVPIAISAFTQETLERSQVAGGPDLMTQVPNMTFTKTNFTSYSIQLRGIGTQAISATTDAAVAVAFNNTPFIRNRFFEQEFYDLQRVEVLRGPQGTLYGRNATAGVVNLISQKPKFGYEAKLSGDIANYSSTRLEGMVNVPLVEDKVALRLAGAWTKRQGYSTNQITGEQIDGRDLWSTRLSLRFSPTDRLDANLIWEHFQENDDRIRSGKQLCHQDDRETVSGLIVSWGGYGNPFSQGCLPASLYSPDSFEAPNGFSLPYYLPLTDAGLPVQPGFNPYASLVQSSDLRVIESTVDPKYKSNSDLVELQWSFDLSDTLSLTSETSYLYDTIYSLQDFNRFNTASGAFALSGAPSGRPPMTHLNAAGNYEFCDPQIGCADRVVAIDVSRARSAQFSQEFRLASDYDGPFNFSLGANYLRYDTEDKYYVFINTLTMFSAAGTFESGVLPPWEANVSDNHECLPHGLQPPDPTKYYRIRGCQYIDPNPIGSVNDLGHNYFLSRNPYKLISYAVFGETYWQLAENLKLTAGLRVTRDMKEAPRIPSWLIASQSAGLSVLAVEEQKWTEPTGRLAIDWKPDLGFTDETLLYASYSHGYKAGGSNPPPAGVVVYGIVGLEQPEGVAKLESSALKPKTFDPEFVDAFEMGAKNTFLDGAVTANLAAFYYDYQGYQVSQIIDRSAVNYNFDSKVWGVELEADWRVAENFRLGLKAGYEKTRIADGEQAIDIMDRTNGDPDWIVMKPFPSFPSNCVFPKYVIDPTGLGVTQGAPGGGNQGPCEFAYAYLLDPVTMTDYGNDLEPTQPPNPDQFPNYPGFNPRHDYGNNNGDGFFKQIGGNELPNAPHFTGTLTADYTLPLPHDWLATLHTDLYYQSEAWTRVFNTEGYDKLKAYTNVNVAAIFTNEDAGWKVMAYVKNVFDRDSITGAFLNSDDTGLTTNVFLTEPRLYGIRVTKDFDGGPWWTGASGTGPFPLWVELGGTVMRANAPYETLAPDQFDQFARSISATSAQNRDLDWGDGREVRFAWKPLGSDLSLLAGVRYGRVNTNTGRLHYNEAAGPLRCSFDPQGPLGFFCDFDFATKVTGVNWSDSFANQKEEHTLVDFAIGMDHGLGTLSRSRVSAGVRYGEFASQTTVDMNGIPKFQIVDGWGFEHPTVYDQYRSKIDEDREFAGVGPELSWDAALQLLGDEAVGHVDLEWSITGGALFGRQKTKLSEVDGESHFSGVYTPAGFSHPQLVYTPMEVSQRSNGVTVPFLDLKLGLAYEIQRVKIGAGYRWERYFDVLDAGYAEQRDYDRTLDGPYFKIAIGFGG